MQTIQINGVTIHAPIGSNVNVINGVVYIDGEKQNEEVGVGTVNVNPMNASFNLSCDGDVQVNGDIGGNVASQGNVSCKDIGGNIAEARDVKAGDIGGNATASNSIHCDDVGGNVVSKSIIQ